MAYSGTSGNQTPAAVGIETRLNFGRDGKVSGIKGCNSYSGDYEVKGGKVVFHQMIFTLMACLEPQMSQEDTAFQIMTGTVRFQIEGNMLTIYEASGTNAITFSR
jgi:heat shock protein HslJ